VVELGNKGAYSPEPICYLDCSLGVMIALWENECTSLLSALSVLQFPAIVEYFKDYPRLITCPTLYTDLGEPNARTMPKTYSS